MLRCPSYRISEPTRQLIAAEPTRPIAAASATIVIPATIANAGERATRRFVEFFATGFRNEHTRTAYLHAVTRFFTWCDRHKSSQLADIDPLLVAAYIKVLGKHVQEPTVKQHLAAIRVLFDWLITGQVVGTNPARAVSSPKYVVKDGQTIALDAGQALKFLDSIDTSSVVGLRDRALISVMTFAFARIGAAVAMRVEDYYPDGKRWWIRLSEKGGKRHEIPAHDTMEDHLNSYINAACLRSDSRGPLFRTAAGCTGRLTERPMTGTDAWRMIQRRAARLGIKVRIGCHTFRATGISAYLEAGGSLESARTMAAHVSLRTTKLYNRSDYEGQGKRED